MKHVVRWYFLLCAVYTFCVFVADTAFGVRPNFSALSHPVKDIELVVFFSGAAAWGVWALQHFWEGFKDRHFKRDDGGIVPESEHIKAEDAILKSYRIEDGRNPAVFIEADDFDTNENNCLFLYRDGKAIASFKKWRTVSENNVLKRGG